MYATNSVAANSILIATPNTIVVPASGRYHSSMNTFAMAAGGGIDIRLSKYVMFRPAQIDYYLAQSETPAFLPNATAPVWTKRFQNNVRIAFGFVFNFNDPSSF
jgi:hypothetical protein